MWFHFYPWHNIIHNVLTHKQSYIIMSSLNTPINVHSDGHKVSKLSEFQWSRPWINQVTPNHDPLSSNGIMFWCWKAVPFSDTHSAEFLLNKFNFDLIQFIKQLFCSVVGNFSLWMVNSKCSLSLIKVDLNYTSKLTSLEYRCAKYWLQFAFIGVIIL